MIVNESVGISFKPFKQFVSNLTVTGVEQLLRSILYSPRLKDDTHIDTVAWFNFGTREHVYQQDYLFVCSAVKWKSPIANCYLLPL